MRALFLTLLALSAAAPAATPTRPDAERGRAVFAKNCAPCHGQGPGIDGSKMLPGSTALAAKYKGELPPHLEQRQDLMAEQFHYFVRNGTGGMPMFRKTEVSDADIDAIAAYIAKTSRATPVPKPRGK